MAELSDNLFLEDLGNAVASALMGEIASTRDDSAEREFLSTPAPNAIEWCVGRDFLNSPSLYNYTRSYQVVRDLFALRCPVCNPGGIEDGQPGDCWGKSRDYLESEVLLVWSKEYEDDVCPKCTMTRAELTHDGLIDSYNQMHLVCGMRSGKSVTAGAMIGTYVEHRLLTIALGCTGGLHGYLGLDLRDPFEMTFLASTDTQSQDTIWSKYVAGRRDSPWFQRFVPWIKSQEENQNTPPGMKPWRYAETEKKIVNEYPDLKLIINSLNSNSGGLVGRTRLAGFIDEIARMHQSDSRTGADEIYRGMENSLQTARAYAKLHGRLPWLGLICSVTSPISRTDKSMQLLKAAENIPEMYSQHYATWEFNPFQPRENFDSAYAKDPVGAQRDFGAQPPMAASPLIHDVPRFRTMVIDEGLVPTARMSYPSVTDPQGQEYITVKLDDATLTYDWQRYIAFDAGRNFDSFAGACAHGEIVENDDGTQRIVTVFDWVIRILPMEGTEVYFDSVFELMRQLRSKQPIVRAEFDRWNSVQIIQQIRQLGVRAEQQPTRDDDFRRFRADAYLGLVRMLPPDKRDLDEQGNWAVEPPVMHPHSCALYELESLEEDPDTQKVTNPRKGQRRGWNSDDVAQVCVHAHKLVQEQGYVKKDDDRSRRAARKRSEGDAAMYNARHMGRAFNPARQFGVASNAGMRNWQGNKRGW